MRNALRKLSPFPSMSWPGTFSLGIEDKIDLCRGLFACLVVSAHARELALSIFHVSDPVASSGRFVHYALGTGVYWVMGFFVLSGYCIQLSVERLTSEGQFQVRNYTLARLTRVLPLYYLALSIAGAVEAFIGSQRPACWPNGINLQTLICQILLVQGFTQTLGCFGPSWSITNELFYYLLFGLLVWAAPRSRNAPTVAGLLICLGFGGALQVAYALGFHYEVVPKLGMLFGLGANWFLGVMVALHRDWLGRATKITAVARFWPVLLVCSMGLLSTERIRPGFVFLLCGLAFALMLIGFLGTESRRGKLPANDSIIGRAARSLGLSSYPLYLFHGPLMLVLGTAMIQMNVIGGFNRVWVVATVISIACSLPLGRFVERPIMAWRSGFLARSRRPFSSRLVPADPGTGTGSRLVGISQ